MISKYKFHLLLLLSAFFYSTSTTVSKYITDEKISLFNQLFWRFSIGALFTLIMLAIFYKPASLRLKRKNISWLLLNSLIFLITTSATTLSIYLGTPPLKTVVLFFLYPIPGLLFSYLLFDEKPKSKDIASITLAIVSLFIFIEVWSIKNMADIHLGDWIALANSICVALFISVGKKTAINTKLNPFTQLFYTLIFGLPILFITGYILNIVGISILQPTIAFQYSLPTWIALLTIGICAGSLSTVLLYLVAPKVSTNAVNIILLTEPIWVVLTSLVLFSQIPTIWNLVGMIGIITAVYLSSKK